MDYIDKAFRIVCDSFFAVLANLALLFVLASCCTGRHVPGGRPVEATDTLTLSSTVRTLHTTVPDTAYVTLPPQTVSRIAADSLSRLETDYAVSTARLNPDGTLSHDLRTRPGRHAVPVDREVILRDSVVYVNHVVAKPVLVEVERPLTRWENFKLRYGGHALCALLALCVAAALRWRIKN